MQVRTSAQDDLSKSRSRRRPARDEQAARRSRDRTCRYHRKRRRTPRQSSCRRWSRPAALQGPDAKHPGYARFARLLAEGLPLQMTLLVCSQGNRQSQSEGSGRGAKEEVSPAATPEPSPFASPQRGASAQDERCNKKINPSTQGEKAGAKGGRPGPLHRLRRVLFLDAKSNRSRARESRQPQA
jgi:hypothetical protein